MHELSILRAALDAPTADCVVSDGIVHSYAEMAERVRAFIARLEATGVNRGDRVALKARVDLDTVVSVYGLAELGCPAALLHARSSAREDETILQDAAPSPDDCFAIVYTSGTSGRSRGAVLSRRAFVASARAHASNLGWDSSDRWMLCMPPSHVGGLSILTRTLIARSCCVLAPQREGAFHAPSIIHELEQERVTLLSVVPTMLSRLLDCPEPQWHAHSLRAVLVGGAPLSDSLQGRGVARGIPLLKTYGCTEACSQVTTQRVDEVGHVGSGRPLEGTQLRITDGEIQIHGPILMDGYLDGSPDEGDVWTEDGWFRTGDSGQLLPSGELAVHGRLDQTIITGGENVAGGEVERVLETVSGVTSACVFPLPHPDWGQEVVAVLAVNATEFDHDALRARVERDLAGYKRPKRICAVESLPLGPTGKVDRQQARKLYESKLRPL